MDCLLSLVIPTNGIKEWVFPVLDSIYSQESDKNLGYFEVIVVDNGTDSEFYDLMTEYQCNYKNIIYKRTNSKLFLNQIEGFRIANGKFIKFVNHRTKLKNGTLQYLIDFVKKNEKSRPITFFLNGTTNYSIKTYPKSEFDSFIYSLGKYSSWSGGISCWKSDLDDILISSEFSEYDLFPHISFVFHYRENRHYIINNEKLFVEIPSSAQNKGRYDVFYAFGVEYVNLINSLAESGRIDTLTKNHVLLDNEFFIAELYLSYILLKKPCSYDLKSYKKSLNYYYNIRKIQIKAVRIFITLMKKKVKSLVIK